MGSDNNVSLLQYIPLSLHLPGLECIMWKTHRDSTFNSIVWICIILFMMPQ